MADKPAPSDEPFKAETEEALDRLAACEAQKREFDDDIRESYAFSSPHRARELRSAQAVSPSKPSDADTLSTEIAKELVKDFVTVVVNAFMPQAEPWAERRPGMFVPDQYASEVRQKVVPQDEKIFAAIRASNLYEVLPLALTPDLAIGTIALWISNPRPAENVVVQAVPLHELEINVGPYGGIDDRFVVRHTKNRHVRTLLGEAIYDSLSAEKKKEIADKPQNVTKIVWGYWRRWERRDDVVWCHVVMLQDKVVHTVDLIGEGSCPLIVARFGPSPEWAFGTGPLIESLADLRSMDTIEYDKIKYVDRVLSPPTTYPDDSSIAIEKGIESGKMYPVRVGSQDAIKSIYEINSMEPAIFELSEKERALRHRFYLDWPEQRGKTPPTATQWLDEMTLLQQRIGTPGSSFWKEGPAQIFLRFKYLLERAGIIEPIKVDGKTVSIEPYNPAQRAAEQQKVAMFARFAQIVGPLFPQEWPLETDGRATMQAVAEVMRVGSLWKQRSEDDRAAALSTISQLIQAKQVQPTDPSAAGQL